MYEVGKNKISRSFFHTLLTHYRIIHICDGIEGVVLNHGVHCKIECVRLVLLVRSGVWAIVWLLKSVPNEIVSGELRRVVGFLLGGSLMTFFCSSSFFVVFKLSKTWWHFEVVTISEGWWFCEKLPVALMYVPYYIKLNLMFGRYFLFIYKFIFYLLIRCIRKINFRFFTCLKILYYMWLLFYVFVDLTIQF